LIKKPLLQTKTKHYISDKDVEAAVFAALRKLVTDPTAQKKFKRQFNHFIAKYIGVLLSDKDS
jgi:hypothetical protein